MNRFAQSLVFVALASVLLSGCGLKGRKGSRFSHPSPTEQISQGCDCYSCQQGSTALGNNFNHQAVVDTEFTNTGEYPITVESIQPANTRTPYYVEESTPTFIEPIPLAEISNDDAFESIAPADIIESDPATDIPQVDKGQFKSPSDIINRGSSTKNESKDFPATNSDQSDEPSSPAPIEIASDANIDADSDTDVESETDTLPQVDTSFAISDTDTQLDPQLAPAKKDFDEQQQKSRLTPRIAMTGDKTHKLRARPVDSLKRPTSLPASSKNLIPAISTSLKKSIPLNSLRPSTAPAPIAPKPIAAQPQPVAQPQPTPIKSLPPQSNFLPASSPRHIRLKAIQPGSDTNVKARILVEPDSENPMFQNVPSTHAPNLLVPDRQGPLFDRFTAQTSQPRTPLATTSQAKALATPLADAATTTQSQTLAPAPAANTTQSPLIETWHERSARIPAGQLGEQLPPWRK